MAEADTKVGSRTLSELERELGAIHERSYAWARACSAYDEDRAKDLLQTCYLKVLDGRAAFAGRSSLTTWFFGVIRKTAASGHRRRMLRRWLLLDSENQRAEEPVSGPDHAVQVNQERTAVREALGRLSSRQHQVIELVFYHELSLSESAVVMGVSLGTARTHYHRGKQELARHLADCRRTQ